MPRIIKLAVLTVSLAVTLNASALGQVSRACSFAEIPSNVKKQVSLFFYALGADSSVLRLPFRELTEQSEYWINESLTTDYGSVRFYLFASRLLYSWGHVDFNDGPGMTNGYKFWNRVDSYWTPSMLSNALKADPNFSPFYANRQLLYSVRAGSPSIVERLGRHEKYHYLVEGRHWYLDPSNGSMVPLASTEAIDCNTADLGIGTHIMDR